eukprot:gb/GFBE01060770.1/.p1 GENE.gb/GFBE01060770.1/~~gb/GFBE01060770.1/.p1  ORF type:complete len:363 (+),score=62.60 gb/GFBE01060770.1/:1-1089(+)
MMFRAVLLTCVLRSGAAARSPGPEEVLPSPHVTSVAGVPVDTVLPLESLSPPPRAELAALEANASAPLGLVQTLLALGGGTGAGVSMGDRKLDMEQLRRMRCQDGLLIVFMLAAYYIALLLSASLSYRQAMNQSPVKYYGDPRVLDEVVESSNEEEFLEAFNQPPKDVQLRVTGLQPIPMMVAGLIDNAIEYQGGYYRAAFSYGLDLSEWLVPGTRGTQDTAELSAPDAEALRGFLQEDSNDLATVQMIKEISWPGWEELATNIKQKIRQCGFDGVVHVNVKHSETLTVYKNKPWANFLHMRSTKTCIALSIVGYPIYLWYMWWRQRGPAVRVKYCVDVDLCSYWQLIGHKISAEGFESVEM